MALQIRLHQWYNFKVIATANWSEGCFYAAVILMILRYDDRRMMICPWSPLNRLENDSWDACQNVARPGARMNTEWNTWLYVRVHVMCCAFFRAEVYPCFAFLQWPFLLRLIDVTSVCDDADVVRMPGVFWDRGWFWYSAKIECNCQQYSQGSVTQPQDATKTSLNEDKYFTGHMAHMSPYYYSY